MQSLISQLREKYDVDSTIAARLGLSRQAFSQAARRGKLSDAAAITAASLLNIDLGAALVANTPAAANLPAPILDAAPNLPSQPAPERAKNTNYALNNGAKLASWNNLGGYHVNLVSVNSHRINLLKET